jgi:hypothetical protein
MKQYKCITTFYSKMLFEAGKFYMLDEEVAHSHKQYLELVPGQARPRKAPAKKQALGFDTLEKEPPIQE